MLLFPLGPTPPHRWYAALIYSRTIGPSRFTVTLLLASVQTVYSLTWPGGSIILLSLSLSFYVCIELTCTHAHTHTVYIDTHWHIPSHSPSLFLLYVLHVITDADLKLDMWCHCSPYSTLHWDTGSQSVYGLLLQLFWGFHTSSIV